MWLRSVVCLCLLPSVLSCGLPLRPSTARKIQAPPKTKEIPKPKEALELIPELPDDIAPPGTNTGFQPRFTGHALNDILGSGVSVKPYDGSGYVKAGGGPAEDLSCDFDGSSCCWINPALPLDQLDWQLGEGNPEPQRADNFLGPLGPQDPTKYLPSGSYLVVATAAVAAADEAQLTSCTIECTDAPVEIELKHWQTYDALLQVCSRAAFQETAPLLNCREIPRSASPGPTKLTLPQDSLFDIVFVASNLVGAEGNAVILDDIKIKVKPCGAARRGSEEEESEYYIDEEDDYKDEEEDYQRSGIGLEPRRISNPRSLVPVALPKTSKANGRGSIFSEIPEYPEYGGGEPSYPIDEAREFFGDDELPEECALACDFEEAGSGEGFAAVFLRPRDKAGIEVAVSFQDDFVIRYLQYEVTQGLQLKGCCDSSVNCPFASPRSVSVRDRAWSPAAFICPAGTRKVLFLCENDGTNQGACGLDSVRLLSVPDSGDPNDATDVLC